jgi:hypothetical protein
VKIRNRSHSRGAGKDSMSMNGLLELVGLRSIIALTTSTAPFWLCVLILLLSLPSPFFSFLFNFPLVLIQTTTLTGRDEYARTIHFTGSRHHCKPTTLYIKNSVNRLRIDIPALPIKLHARIVWARNVTFEHKVQDHWAPASATNDCGHLLWIWAPE